MLKDLLSIIPAGTARHPLVFYRLLDTVEARLNVAKNKYMIAPLPRTRGVEFLRWMLLNFNMNEAFMFKDDISLFTEMIPEYQTSFRTAFDPVWTNTITAGRYVRSRTKTFPAEILLNCTVENPADYYPFNKGYEDWKNVRAIHLVHHNSTELPIDLVPGYLSFNTKAPSFVALSVNIPTLLMKWFKFYKNEKSHRNPHPNEMEFLHEEFSHFFDDALEIWTTNMFLTVLAHPDAPIDKLVAEITVPQFITSDGILKNGVSALKEMLKLIKSRNMKMQDFLDTCWYKGGYTIRNIIERIDATIVLPDDRRYLWVNLFKVLPYLRIITYLVNQDPENPLFNSLMRKAYWAYIKSIKYAKLPSIQHSFAIKVYVTAVSNEFEKLFKDKIDVQEEATA